MRTRLLIASLLLVAGFCSSAAAQKCLEYGPVVSLTGKLRSQVFAGPPNYESIKHGDQKETAIILTLSTPTCTTGNDPSGVDVPETNLREMQLVLRRSEDWKTVHRRMGKRVVASGTLFHSITGHHVTRVLIDVTGVRASP
ncbi:MAG TPA: DUF4431 domain-containing protein [Pyrinomonadaceae bacterium]|nr:DUF4431 domain-containing protein [Pyrinomonadaceae bacterium]